GRMATHAIGDQQQDPVLPRGFLSRGREDRQVVLVVVAAPTHVGAETDVYLHAGLLQVWVVDRRAALSRWARSTIPSSRPASSTTGNTLWRSIIIRRAASSMGVLAPTVAGGVTMMADAVVCAAAS